MLIRHIVISGPSASGKSTLIKMLLKAFPNLSLSISHTTRPMRQGEVDGKDYYFVSRSTFEDLIKNRRMLEYAEFNEHYYGTSLSELEDTPKVFDVEFRGVSYFKENYPSFLYIFIDCDRETVRKRLIARGDRDLKARLELYDEFQKIKNLEIFQKIINNNNSKEESFEQLSSFIKENL
ncbi:Guanylate kinase [Nosema granulosis]|uniref:Guanylate kinase n=1 Tax=Nosema granulosis TaxID=83296 RepID=A0A9P6KYY8_9MICR|nr:Guanylate kinase [Nosema granulosis]